MPREVPPLALLAALPVFQAVDGETLQKLAASAQRRAARSGWRCEAMVQRREGSVRFTLRAPKATVAAQLRVTPEHFSRLLPSLTAPSCASCFEPPARACWACATSPRYVPRS